VYNKFVKTANALFKQELASTPNLKYWRMKGLKAPQCSIFLDGVHMNKAGFERYHRNIRGPYFTV
jgi:hypothetical protein